VHTGHSETSGCEHHSFAPLISENTGNPEYFDPLPRMEIEYPAVAPSRELFEGVPTFPSPPPITPPPAILSLLDLPLSPRIQPLQFQVSTTLLHYRHIAEQLLYSPKSLSQTITSRGSALDIAGLFYLPACRPAMRTDSAIHAKHQLPVASLVCRR